MKNGQRALRIRPNVTRWGPKPPLLTKNAPRVAARQNIDIILYLLHDMADFENSAG